MTPPIQPRRPTDEEIKAIASGATVSIDIKRFLDEVDDGSVAAEISRVQSTEIDVTVRTDIQGGTEDRFLDEFAAAHKAGIFGEGSIVEAPEAAGYEIEGEISRGAQGAVFLARQKTTRRQVALKVLLRGAFASERQLIRFEREVEMVAALKHPGIVTVYDSGTTEDGRGWLAMEFIDGLTMDTWLAANAPTERDAKRRLVTELIATTCDAVAAAHLKGVIHRDLKPDNILVDAGGAPHVLDFGLAKPVDDSEWDSSRIEVTTAGEFMGTFAYASPEQVSGDPDRIDIRTDVFALGVILYEALVGQRPYVLEGSIADVLKTIAEAIPIPPRSVEPTLERDLETILLRALDRDVDRRYQGPADLARDLRHWLCNEPIEARRDDAWYVTRKFLRRHWLPVGLGVGTVAVLIAFGITMFVAWGRATEANERLRGTVGMVSNVLGAADAENVDQPLAASSMGEMMHKWLQVVDTDLTDYPMIAAAVRLDLAQNHIGNSRWDDAKDAIDRAAESIELATDSPSPTAGRLLHLRGRLRYKEADYARAVDDYRAALHHRQTTDPESEDTATTMHHLGASLRRLGEADESDRVLTTALHRHRELVSSARGDTDVIRRRVALSNLLNSMAVGHVVNRPQQALPLLREAVVLVEVDSADLAADWRIAALRHNIGNCLARLGQLEAAETSLTEALRIKELQGNPVSIANTEAALARLSVLQGDSAAGRFHFDRAHSLRGDLLPAGHPSHRDELLIEIELLLMDGELNQAASKLDVARKATNSTLANATIKRLDGLLAEARGNLEIAETLIGEALQSFADATGVQSPQARKCLATLARLAEKRGDPTTAAQLADRARPPSEVSGGDDASQ